MRVVSITEMRQAGARVVREAQQADDPTLIVVNSRPAAYLVGVAQYDALRAEIERLRREALEREVEIAMEEVRRGEFREYASAAELMADIEAEIAAENNSTATARDAGLPQGREAADSKPAKGGRTRAQSSRSPSR